MGPVGQVFAVKGASHWERIAAHEAGRGCAGNSDGLTARISKKFVKVPATENHIESGTWGVYRQ
jgi:hypothetical protein